MGELGSLLESFDTFARPILQSFLNSFWQGMIIATLVLLFLRVFKRISATTRHAVWLVCLLTIGTLPLIGLIALVSMPNGSPPNSVTQPDKPERKLPMGQSAEPQETPETDPLLIEDRIARLYSPVRLSRSHLATDPAKRIDEAARFFTLEESSKAMPAITTVTAPVTKVNANRAEWMSFPQRVRNKVASFFNGWIPMILVSIWLTGFALMLCRIAHSYAALFRLRRRFGFVPSAQRERVQRLAEIFGIQRRVRIFTSKQVSVPMTIGSIRPMIILPRELSSNLSVSEFESVIAHELAHIKRWDYLTNLVQRIVQAYLFFHPAVWFAGKHLMIERELACDDWAVKTCEPRRYATCLTKLVQLLSESKPLVAAAGILFGKQVISRRVEMILNRDRNATTAVSKLALLYSTGLVVSFVVVFSLISPVIAVPLAQNRAGKQQTKKEVNTTTAAQTKSKEISPVPAPPALPAGAPQLPNLPDVPEPPEAQTPATSPVFAVVEADDVHSDTIVPVISEVAAAPRAVSFTPATVQEFGLAPVQSYPMGNMPNSYAPAAVLNEWAQDFEVKTPRPAPARRPAVIAGSDQDDKNKPPAISESELLTVLTDIVKRDADPSVRNEALAGICRMRSDAAINTLIELYDGSSDVKVKGEIIGYLLRRNADNSKAIAKLMAVAKSETNEELRVKAIRNLGSVKGDEGATNLIQIYDGLQDSKMKQRVIGYLANNKSRKAIDKLIQIAKNDSDPNVRQAAIRGLYGIDQKFFLELVDKDKPKISLFDTVPREWTFDGSRIFEFDTKKWEEMQKEWQEKWEEHQEKSKEKYRELLEKLRIENLDKLKLELPKIELRLRELENDINLGRDIDSREAIERQLQSQMVQLEAQLAAFRTHYGDSHPKVAEARNLIDALERHYEQVRAKQPRRVQKSAIRVAQPRETRPVVVRPARLARPRVTGGCSTSPC